MQLIIIPAINWKRISYRIVDSPEDVNQRVL